MTSPNVLPMPDKAAKPNIVHEADAQRQYVRVPLPAHLLVNGTIYTVPDWSVRGATVQFSKPEGELRPGKSLEAVLLFNMDSFALQIPMHITVEHISADGRRAGVTFKDMSQRQLSVMQQMVSAYINGELVSVGDLIHVVERNNFVKQRAMPKAEALSLKDRTSLLLRKAILLGASLALFAFIALSVYERNFIIKASNAYVDAGSFTVNTPGGGTVYYNSGIDQGDAVPQGAPLATIQSRTGATASITSPCDCVINQMLVAHGNIVNEGASIITLVPKEALTYVTAYVPYDHAKELYEGQQARISLAGTKIRMTGKIDYISSQAATRNDLYKLRIVSEERIDPSLLGTAAHVSFDTLR